MSRAPVRQCTNCALATWQRTEKGNIKRSVSGRCRWEPPKYPVAVSIQEIAVRKSAIHAGGGVNCPTWEYGQP